MYWYIIKMSTETFDLSYYLYNLFSDCGNWCEYEQSSCPIHRTPDLTVPLKYKDICEWWYGGIYNCNFSIDEIGTYDCVNVKCSYCETDIHDPDDYSYNIKDDSLQNKYCMYCMDVICSTCYNKKSLLNGYDCEDHVLTNIYGPRRCDLCDNSNVFVKLFASRDDDSNCDLCTSCSNKMNNDNTNFSKKKLINNHKFLPVDVIQPLDICYNRYGSILDWVPVIVNYEPNYNQSKWLLFRNYNTTSNNYGKYMLALTSYTSHLEDSLDMFVYMSNEFSIHSDDNISDMNCLEIYDKYDVKWSSKCTNDYALKYKLERTLVRNR